MDVVSTPSRGQVRLTADWGRPAGRVRQLHGGAEGPRCFNGSVDLTEHHLGLRFPVNRVQHPDYPPVAVDIHTIFPDLAADPTRPESYDFRRTDDHIRAILATGAEISYRLGEPIEHALPRHTVAPPPDFERWAEVCVGIARHYTQGWADGFDRAIRYWEVWNEPDIPQQWSGTPEEYYRLYEVASKAIKAACPDVRVGGPALSGTREFGQDPPGVPPFADGFLRHVSATGAPLDFFSWHWYGYDSAEPARRAVGVRRMLDERGFAAAESHLNEWNYLPPGGFDPLMSGPPEERRRRYQEVHGMPGAAFAAAMLVRLQDSPVDVANYYTTDTQAFWGMFDPFGVPRAPYHAFLAFKALVDLGDRVATSGGYPTSGVDALAAVDGGRTQAAVLVANPADPRSGVELAVEGLPWAGPTLVERWVVRDGGLELVSAHHVIASGVGDAAAFEITVPLEAPAIALVRLRPGPVDL